MKTAIYLSLFLLVAATSCRKKDKGDGGNKCNYALFALQKKGPSKYKLVSIDTVTGQSNDNLPFQEVNGARGHLNMNDNCYYALQTDDSGTLVFIKFDLINRTQKVFNGPHWGSANISPFELAYSTLSSKFYFLHSIPGNSISTYSWHFYEMSLHESTFTFAEVAIDIYPNLMFKPLISDPVRGMIYYRTLYDYAAFAPGEKEAISLPEQLTSYRGLQVCRNDQLLYGIMTDAYGIPLTFAKIDLIASLVTKVSDIAGLYEPLPSYASFDQCRGQYIIQNGEDGTINLFWLDIKDGSVRKRLTANDSYEGIMCVNLE